MCRITLLLVAMLAGGYSVADEIEEPAWQLVKQLDEVEIRQYAPTIQARTPMTEREGSSSGFRRLAGYIFGGNDQEQSIAMTAPVEQTLHTEPSVMAFTLPAKYAWDELPTPDDDSVSLVPVPERTMAAIRFSGWATDGQVDSRTAELLAVLAEHGVRHTGTPTLNQYNPPWTLPFLRRNEIMVEVLPDSVETGP